jgi:hypothetical protein
MVHSVPSMRRWVGLGREAREPRLSVRAGDGQSPAATYNDTRRNVLAEAETLGYRTVAAIWGWD